MIRARRYDDTDARTCVDLVWWQGRVERWLRFGLPMEEVIHDRRRRTAWFAPGALFAVVRWQGGDYGTTESALDILVAALPGTDITTRPGVTPGGVLLAAFEGWTRVRRGLEAIDAVEAAGFAPHAVAPDYWRHVHNRIAAGLPPRAYDRARHRAWRLRRGLAS